MCPDEEEYRLVNTSLIIVRFWAGARAAAGVGEVSVEGADGPSLTDLLDRVMEAVAPERRDHLTRVVAACSVLVDGQGTAGRAPATVRLEPGQTVELLPPFAGG